MVKGQINKVMAAHQPNFFPYLGFFDKMMNSDVFVIRDECLFIERDYHHRNRIRIEGKDKNGEPQWKWLTVPVKKEKKDLKDIAIKNDIKQKNLPWNEFMLKQINDNYQKAQFFETYYPEIENLILSKNERLIDLSMSIIISLKNFFGINTEIVYASELPEYEKTYDASVDLANLTKAVNANVYLSGSGGRGYLDLEPFEREDIEVRFQEFHHPTHKQIYPGFVPNLASIDTLFNVGNIFENINLYNLKENPVLRATA